MLVFHCHAKLQLIFLYFVLYLFNQYLLSTYELVWGKLVTSGPCLCAGINESARSCSMVGTAMGGEGGPAYKRQNFTGNRKSFSLSLAWEGGRSELRNQNWRGGFSWAEFCRQYCAQSPGRSTDWIRYVQLQRRIFGGPGSREEWL